MAPSTSRVNLSARPQRMRLSRTPHLRQHPPFYRPPLKRVGRMIGRNPASQHPTRFVRPPPPHQAPTISVLAVPVLLAMTRRGLPSARLYRMPTMSPPTQRSPRILLLAVQEDMQRIQGLRMFLLMTANLACQWTKARYHPRLAQRQDLQSLKRAPLFPHPPQ